MDNAELATRTPMLTRVRVTLSITSAIFALLAFISLVGPFLFVFPEKTLFAYAFGALMMAVGVLFLITGFRIHAGDRWAWDIARVLLLLELAWSASKIIYWREPEAWVFGTAAFVALVLLNLPPVRRFFLRGDA